MALTLPALFTRLPRGRRVGKTALLAAAALTLPLLMPPGTASTASAGETRWSVTVGNHGKTYSNHRYESRSRHYDRGHRDRSYTRDHYRGHSGGHSSGYYKQVWVPPVYATRYDPCGRSYQVCVRNGYHKQVYVSTSRSRDYNRRGQWGNSGSCRSY